MGLLALGQETCPVHLCVRYGVQATLLTTGSARVSHPTTQFSRWSPALLHLR
jgi:hypothetical protein